MPGRGGSRGEETAAGEGRALFAFDPGGGRGGRYNHLVLARSQIQEVFPLAACPWLAENSRLGFRLVGSTLHQGPQPFKYLNGVGDTTSVVWNSWPESLKAQKQIDKVAMSAEKEALRLTRADGLHHEYGGWIIQNNEDGSLSYTPPVKGQETLIDLSKIPVPDGFTIVGDYHTHPHRTRAEGEGADPGDVNSLRGIAKKRHLDIPGYVADTFSGSVYRYTQWGPPMPKTMYDTNPFGVKIGTIPPD